MNKSEVVVIAPMAVEKKGQPVSFWTRAGVAASLVVAGLLASDAGAQSGLTFDVSSVQTSVMTILGVGVAIAVAFAIYRVGKRATGRM